MNNNQYYGTGRRKESTARIFLKNGNGLIKINKRSLDEYFKSKKSSIILILQPLKLFNLENILDLYITVKGGGLSAQSEAIRLGISRALLKFNNKFKKKLKEFGFITRDSRSVERKKIGLKKARKKPQFSKR